METDSNHSGCLSLEERCSPSIRLKRKTPNEGHEGSHSCRVRILLCEPKWGSRRPHSAPFLFQLPFWCQSYDKCLALKLDVCLKKICPLRKIGFPRLLKFTEILTFRHLCWNANLSLSKGLSDISQVLKFSNEKLKASLVGTLKWPLAMPPITQRPDQMAELGSSPLMRPGCTYTKEQSCFQPRVLSMNWLDSRHCPSVA